MLNELKTIINPNSKIQSKTNKAIWNKINTIVFPVLIAFFLKCPMCWASYMNLLGLSGLISIPHKPWLIYVFIGLAIFNLWNLYHLAKKRNGMLPFYLACIASVILGLNFWLDFGKLIIAFGFAFTFTATLLNSLSFKKYHQLVRFFNERKITLKLNN